MRMYMLICLDCGSTITAEPEQLTTLVAQMVDKHGPPTTAWIENPASLDDPRKSVWAHPESAVNATWLEETLKSDETGVRFVFCHEDLSHEYIMVLADFEVHIGQPFNLADVFLIGIDDRPSGTQPN